MKKVSLVLVLACVFLLTAGGTAFAEEPLYTENAQCMECHGADLGGPATKKVDFGVGAVNKETACAKCHWINPHPFHNPNSQCRSCHGSWPFRLDFYSAAHVTDYGYFSYSTSPDTSAERLHSIHANGSWPQDIPDRQGCGSCHGSVGCDACHEGVATHGQHTYDAAMGTYLTAPESYVAAYGTDAANSTADTRIAISSTCTSAGCHERVNAAIPRISRIFDQTDSSSWVFSTGWVQLNLSGTYGNSVALGSSAGNAAIATIEGPGRIRLYGSRRYNGGIVNVSIDDGPAFPIDTYGTTTINTELFTEWDLGELSAGSHQIVMTVTGRKNPLSSGIYVMLDAIEVIEESPVPGQFVPFCGSCHSAQTVAHGYDTIDHMASDGLLSGVACSACHALDLSTEHNKTSSSSAALGCAACHPSPRDTLTAWDQGCVTGGCHTALSSAPMHASTATAHAVVPDGEVCLTCHTGGTDLESIHASATVDATGASSCFVCHGGATPPPTSNCTDSRCHFTFENHYDGVVHTSTWDLANCNASGCHSTRDLMGAHTEKNAAFDCMGCHQSTIPAVVTAIKDGITACGACHEGVTETSGHYAVHMASPPLEDADGPNYGYWTGSASTAPTSDCSGCHTSNLVDEHLGIESAVPGVWTIKPRYDSTGAALTCATCHNSLDTAIMSAISLGFTRCDACHVVHAPINRAHDSTFVASPEVDCTPCHSSVLNDEHNGSYSTTTPSGVTLTGCSVCHGYYEAPLGPVIQAAISETNSTLCTACHAVDHPDLGSHSATSTASLACGASGCHSGFGSPMDIKAVHAEADSGACAVCHTSSARVPDITLETAECVSCHAVEGVEYHAALPAAHTFAAMDSSCFLSGCHSANTLPEAHAAYLTENPAYATTCALCHDNPSRIPDITTKTADCSSCHTVHGDIAVIHQAPDSSACVDCHETADVRDLHPTCATCHNATVDTSGTAACASDACHGSAYPVKDPDHYPVVAHTAVETGCSDCHSMDMKTEHAKSTVNVSCVQCHETKVDYFTAPWDKTCGACHPTTHGDRTTKHTALASPECARCHDKDISVGVNVEPVHASAPQGECAVCHVSSTRVPDFTIKTAECASCHASSTVDYHRQMDGEHTFSAMDPGCVAAGCHVSSSLPAEHARFMGRYPAYADTCALCHLNPTRIPDIKTKTADCSSCHTVHGDIAVIHQAPDSSACVDCHETPDVRDLHPTCATCHNATVDTSGTAACASDACHGTNYPTPDPSHYDTTKHTANESGCGQCHFMDMKAEHFKPTVAVTCVQCHETKVDYFTAVWDLSCAACHPTKHGDRNQKHVSSNTSCADTGCHDITDVSNVHQALAGNGCNVCHKSASEPATTTNCTAAGCHADVGTDHHAAHDGQVANGAGCEGCHFRYLDDEHAALGLTCATCHASANTVVKGAIAAGDVRCLTCHPDSAHNARQAVEFGAGNASMHRVSADLPGMRSSFVVNGTTYTWSLPSASTFLKTGWTTSSMMTCASCHTYSGSTGPHGAAMKINIDPAYPNSFKIVAGSSAIAQLSPNSATGMSSRDGGSTAAGVICEKCHDLRASDGSWSNVVHKEHDDRGNEGGYCNFCHTSIPHGWGRPRLLGYTTDDAAHRVYTGGTQRITIKSYTPNGWNKSDCGAGCSSSRHPLSGSSWPNIMSSTPAPTTGNVSGKVTVSGTTTALSGATVTIGTKTATSATDGTYSITALNAGTYTVTVTKTGYTNYSGSVTVTSGSTTTHNAALQAVATTGDVSGTVTDAQTNAAVGSATVTIGTKTATTTSSGTYSITGLNAGSYTITVSKTGYTNYSSTVSVTSGSTATHNVLLQPIAATNLALGKQFSASEYESSSYAPSKAGDGSTSSYWWSDRRGSSTATEWLRVDLGSSTSISKVEVAWYGSYYAKNFKVYTSTDGSNWSQVYSTTSGTSGTTTITFSSRNARYIKLECTRTGSGNNNGYGVAELRVFR